MVEVTNRHPKIFIICGTARQGKDTVGSYIRDYYKEAYDKNSSVLQFSYYIKNYAMQLSDWDGSEETKPRTFLQELGTDVIRKHIDTDFFAHRVVEDIKVFSFYFDVLTLTDGRFASEINYVKREFPEVKIIRVIRPNFEVAMTEEQKHHATETGLVGFDDFDYTIMNDGTLEDLKQKTIALVKEIEHED